MNVCFLTPSLLSARSHGGFVGRDASGRVPAAQSASSPAPSLSAIGAESDGVVEQADAAAERGQADGRSSHASLAAAEATSSRSISHSHGGSGGRHSYGRHCPRVCRHDHSVMNAVPP